LPTLGSVRGTAPGRTWLRDRQGASQTGTDEVGTVEVGTVHRVPHSSFRAGVVIVVRHPDRERILG